MQDNQPLNTHPKEHVLGNFMTFSGLSNSMLFYTGKSTDVMKSKLSAYFVKYLKYSVYTVGPIVACSKLPTCFITFAPCSFLVLNSTPPLLKITVWSRLVCICIYISLAIHIRIMRGQIHTKGPGTRGGGGLLTALYLPIKLKKTWKTYTRQHYRCETKFHNCHQVF